MHVISHSLSSFHFHLSTRVHPRRQVIEPHLHLHSQCASLHRIVPAAKQRILDALRPFLRELAVAPLLQCVERGERIEHPTATLYRTRRSLPCDIHDELPYSEELNRASAHIDAVYQQFTTLMLHPIYNKVKENSRQPARKNQGVDEREPCASVWRLPLIPIYINKQNKDVFPGSL